MLLKNKRGDLGDSVVSTVFLFTLAIIALGIVTGILIFFGSQYDFKQFGADMLNSKIRDCLTGNDFDLERISLDELVKLCGLNKKIIDEKKISIKLCMDSEECISDNHPLIVSGSDFQVCGLKGVKDNSNYPKCSMSKISKKERNFDLIIKNDEVPWRESF